ncbi:MAG: DUF3857 domain-containing protein [Planctomycetota bacterium]
MLRLITAAAASLAATASAFSAPVFAPAPAVTQDLEPVARLMAMGDQPGMLRQLLVELSSAEEAWAKGSPVDPELTAALESKLALANLARPQDFLWRSALDGVDVSAYSAPLAARIARLCDDATSLAPLASWQVVGPFDNERGRGMTRRTPAELNPAAGPYAGKVREVTWRTAPAPGRDGVLYLGDLFRPNEQICVLARTWIQADEARTATLLIGASEELRVWWNGAPAYEALGGHDFGHDGHAISVELTQGWNELTLKVGGQDAPPMASARLVDPTTGEALDFPQAATPPEGSEPAELTKMGRRLKRSSGTTAPGALRFYANRTDSASVLARAVLKAEARSVPRKSRPGFNDSNGALLGKPDSLAAAVTVLSTMRVTGAIEVEEDVNPWLDVLNGAIEQHGSLPQLAEWYATFAEQSQGLPERALGLVEESSAAFPRALLPRLAQVRLLAAIGQDTLSENAARQLARDPAIAEWPDQCVGLSAYLPQGDPLHWQLIEFAAEAGDRRALARLDTRSELRGEKVSAQAFLAKLRTELDATPYENDRRLWAARRLLAQGAASASLELLDEALTICPEDHVLHSWRSRVLLAQGERERAIEALALSCELDPTSADELRLLEHLRREGDGGAAGKGEAEFHESFIEPLEAIAARYPASGHEDALADAPREVLLHRQVVEVGADGRARHYRRVVERVLSDAGVKELDTRRFFAYRGAEDLRVLSVRVLHPDGTISEGPTDRGSQISIDLPPLEVGDVVDIQWRRDDITTSIFGSYFGLDASFASDPRLRTREAAITIIESPEVQLHYHLTGSEIAAAEVQEEANQGEDGAPMRTWSVQDLTPRRAEALEPPPRERVLRLQASTYADWPSFGNWWWNLISEEIAVSPEMREKVEELTRDQETRADKLRAIYDFVVTEIRYNAWEFGVHGYQPYSAPVIFSRRFGDCKDKAILMRAMLGEVGIEAWPVLIQSEGRRFEEDHSLPLVAHFNHCIAYGPEQEGIDEMFLDGTARLHPLEVLPDSDRGARVLTVRSDDVSEMSVPFPAASENERRDTIVVDLADLDAPRVQFTQEPSGRWDPQLRYRMATDEAQRAEAVEALMTQRFGAVRGDIAAEHADYENLTRPLRVTFRAELERVGRATSSGRELPTTFAPFRLVQGIASETERTTDVLLDVPWSSVRTIEYRLPEGASIAHVPAPISVDHPDLGYERTVSVAAPNEGSGGAQVVTIEERMELRTHRVPVERYRAFRESARRIDAAQRETVAIEVAR